jgi:hypothetical protein
MCKITTDREVIANQPIQHVSAFIHVINEFVFPVGSRCNQRLFPCRFSYGAGGFPALGRAFREPPT